jgi:hypothetical protein
MKSEVMACKGQVPMRSKFIIHDMLGCKISYEKEKDMTSKINIFLLIFGTLNNVPK